MTRSFNFLSRFHPAWCWAGLFGSVVGLVSAAPHPTFPFTVPALQLVTTEADFAPFGRQVAATVAAELKQSPPPDGARLKLLLGLRVHLALHFGDDAAARDAANRIRALQTDPAERAHAGLTTEAILAAHHDPAAFEREFSQRLAALPRTAAMREVLTRARDRIVATTETVLLDDVRQNLAPRLARGEPCTLEIADQLVRIRHRLAGILPLRAAMLRAYERALAAPH